MEFNFNSFDIIAILSIVGTFLAVSRIDNVMKRANIDEKIRLQVNIALLFIVILVTLLSGYILFIVM